jgi:ribose/xylose/arabinose/galactoside ABC-type transport system permease subunit
VIEGYGLPGKTGPAVSESRPASSLSELVARARSSDIRPLTAWVLALALFFTYAALQPGVISRDQIGGVDLSIPWVLNASAVLLTIWANGSNSKTLWLFPVLLAGGAVVGALNGVGVAFLKIPPITMTLGMSSMVEGALLLYTKSVAAVAIGGASILGGTGNYVGTTAGALVLAVLAAILPILGFTQATLEIVYGCVILIAVSLSSLRLSGKRALD